MEVKSKNETIESLTNEHQVLILFVSKQRRQLAKQTKIEKELESKLIQKETRICELEERLKLSLIVVEQEFSKLSKTQNKKLIEKENQILNLKNEIQTYKSQQEKTILKPFEIRSNIWVMKTDKEFSALYKTQNKKLSEKENEICDLKKTQSELKSKLSEKENEIFYFNKTQDELKSQLIEKENEISNFNRTQDELKSKVIEKENQIQDIYKTQNKLESNLIQKDNHIRVLESKIETCKKLKNEQSKANQEKIKVKQIENRSQIWVKKIK